MATTLMPAFAAAGGGSRIDDCEDPLVVPGAGARWCVLHTLSRREKRIASACAHHAVRHYLPLRPGRVATRSRERAMVPLFPGYVFACLGDEGGRRVLEGGGIVRILPVRRPEALLEELRRIRFALEAGADLSPTANFRRGRMVRVAAGPLRGLVGEIAERRVRRGALRLILNVSMLGQGATVEIDPGDVEFLPGPARRAAADASDPEAPRPQPQRTHSPSGAI